jgi:hypothetical protein
MLAILVLGQLGPVAAIVGGKQEPPCIPALPHLYQNLHLCTMQGWRARDGNKV